MRPDFEQYAAEVAEGLKEDAAPALATITAAELQSRDIPPIKWTVVDLLAVGLNIIASPPKFGKSWMALDLCLSVTSGWKFLGYQTYKGNSLYLALEDSERRLKSRMEKLLNGRKAPAGFDFSIAAPDMDNGLFDVLEGYLKQHPQTSLVVIDTLQRVRGAAHGREGAYASDYREMAALKSFADQHNICLVVIHHLRKMGDMGDPFDRISGTQGVFGAADMAGVLVREKRGSDTTTFSVTGRDIENQDLVLSFDKNACRWQNMGDAGAYAEQQARQEYQESPIVKTIKTLLKQSSDGSWTGTAQQLLDAGTFIARTRLAPTARDLSSQIKQMDNLLFEYDGIIHERKRNGSGGGKHTFHYPPKFDELPQSEIIPFSE